METIQRVPGGLAPLLSIFGGVTPRLLEDAMRGVIELTQAYGLAQRVTIQNTSGALAEGALVQVVPSATNWSLLFAMCGVFAKTATMTALSGVLFLKRGGDQDIQLAVASANFTPFGATENGNVFLPFTPGYPMLLPPGATLAASPNIIGTDPNANVTVRAEIGILG